MKIYVLESLDEFVNIFRFVSLFNGTQGTWGTEKHAIEEGEQHQRIIYIIHPELMN